jgi:adenylate cyclase
VQNGRHVAARLQSNADDNNILLNNSTYLQVYRHVQSGQPFEIPVKNKSVLLKARYLLGLSD